MRRLPKKYRGGRNDCLRRCVAILTGRPPHRVPHFVGLYGGRWPWYLARWCDRTGHAMFMLKKRGRIHWSNDKAGPWCAIGPNRTNGGHHATVVSAAGVIWDGGVRLRRVDRFLLIWRVVPRARPR